MKYLAWKLCLIAVILLLVSPTKLRVAHAQQADEEEDLEQDGSGDEPIPDNNLPSDDEDVSSGPVVSGDGSGEPSATKERPANSKEETEKMVENQSSLPKSTVQTEEHISIKPAEAEVPKKSHTDHETIGSDPGGKIVIDGQQQPVVTTGGLETGVIIGIVAGAVVLIIILIIIIVIVKRRRNRSQKHGRVPEPQSV